jgi:hypothetical protein
MKGPKDNSYEGKGYSTSGKSSKGDDDEYSSSNSSKVMMMTMTTTIMVEVARDTTKTRAKDTLGIERALIPRGVTNANDTLFISPVLILCRTK